MVDGECFERRGEQAQVRVPPARVAGNGGNFVAARFRRHSSQIH
jgi:hypothetical protein